jgi:hypothetical protein
MRPVLLALLGSALLIPSAVAQGTFAVTGSMAHARDGHTATLLKDGRVLIAGACDSVFSDFANSGFVTAEIYDPSTGKFTPTGNMIVRRCDHTATVLSDGRVLMVGGDVGFTTIAELYNPITGTFTPAGITGINTGLYDHAANLLQDGRVLISSSTAAEFYDPVTGIFSPAGPLKDWGTRSVVLKDGRLLIVTPSEVSIYDVVNDSLQPVATFPGTYSVAPSVTLLANGDVLIAGGAVSPQLGYTTSRAWLYNYRLKTLERTGDMLFQREYATATLLPNGHVLIVGGYDDATYNGGYLSQVEEYDPLTGRFTYVGPDAWGRDSATATLLPNGTVLITGGDSYTNIPSELYSPGTVWQQVVYIMKTVAGTNNLNFWQWSYYWQSAPPFLGAPSGFGVSGSISPDLEAQITSLGGGDARANISAEEWVAYYQKATQASAARVQ